MQCAYQSPVGWWAMVDASRGKEPIGAESTGVGDMHYGEGKHERNKSYQRLRAGAGEGTSAQACV